MADVVTLPKLGLSEYGEIVSWEVSVGETVEADDLLVVIESDKASAEVRAPRAGVLLTTYVDEGEEIAIEPGRPIAVIGADGETAPSLDELESDGEIDIATTTATGPEEESTAQETGDAGSDASEDVTATPRAKRYADEAGVDLAGIEGTGPQGAITEDDIRAATSSGDDETATDRVKATPRAKQAAREHDVDLSEIEGTGPQGAVSESDVETHLEERTAEADDSTPGTDESTASGAVGSSDELTVTETRTLSGTRKTIADRLSRSAREKPHVMGTREISVERLEEVRAHLASEVDMDLTLNDLLLFVVGRTLVDCPQFNAHFVDGEHRLIEEVNVGYAVDTDRGLIVPVIDEVPDRTVTEVAEARQRKVERVLADDHAPADLQGGTFTVTNVGVFDMDISFSIINPPQVAILALGRRKPAPVERGGEIRFEECVTFSLTIDHRVLDGGDSGAFLDQLAEYIEYPGRILDAI